MMMDRINGLSDEVISHILSFLPIKESALTSVLSKRWRYLFCDTRNLHFDEGETEGNVETFMAFVDNVLATSANFPLRKISIKGRADSGFVTGWITDMAKRGVSYVDLDIITRGDAILVPIEIFTCHTIVELKLQRGFDAMIPDDVSLPLLKNLFLESVYFYNTEFCVLEKLLSASPLLEELTIRSESWQHGICCRTISSPSLKKLTIDSIHRLHYWDMALDTPSLSFLELFDLVPRNYPFVNLHTLVEAKLDLLLTAGNGNPTNFIKALTNVQVLELSSVHTSQMFYDFREAIPEFTKLFRLSVTTDLIYYLWKYLPVLLRKSPNLQTLVIQGPLRTGNCKEEYDGLLCPLKVVKITEYRGTVGELMRIKHFLRNFPCLELVQVHACAVNDMEKSRLTDDLLTLPRSSKCIIQINFL